MSVGELPMGQGATGERTLDRERRQKKTNRRAVM